MAKKDAFCKCIKTEEDILNKVRKIMLKKYGYYLDKNKKTQTKWKK